MRAVVGCFDCFSNYGTEPFFCLGFGHPSGGRFLARAVRIDSFQLPVSLRRSAIGPLVFLALMASVAKSVYAAALEAADTSPWQP